MAHTLSATVTDSCGNTTSAFGYETLDGVEAPTAITFTVDTVAPVLTLTSPPMVSPLIPTRTWIHQPMGSSWRPRLPVDPTASLEEGQTIEILIDGTSAETIPADLLMGADQMRPSNLSFLPPN